LIFIFYKSIECWKISKLFFTFHIIRPYNVAEKRNVR